MNVLRLSLLILIALLVQAATAGAQTLTETTEYLQTKLTQCKDWPYRADQWLLWGPELKRSGTNTITQANVAKWEKIKTVSVTAAKLDDGSPRTVIVVSPAGFFKNDRTYGDWMAWSGTPPDTLYGPGSYEGSSIRMHFDPEQCPMPEIERIVKAIKHAARLKGAVISDKELF